MWEKIGEIGLAITSCLVVGLVVIDLIIMTKAVASLLIAFFVGAFTIMLWKVARLAGSQAFEYLRGWYRE